MTLIQWRDPVRSQAGVGIAGVLLLSITVAAGLGFCALLGEYYLILFLFNLFFYTRTVSLFPHCVSFHTNNLSFIKLILNFF